MCRWPPIWLRSQRMNEAPHGGIERKRCWAKLASNRSVGQTVHRSWSLLLKYLRCSCSLVVDCSVWRSVTVDCMVLDVRRSGQRRKFALTDSDTYIDRTRDLTFKGRSRFPFLLQDVIPSEHDTSHLPQMVQTSGSKPILIRVEHTTRKSRRCFGEHRKLGDRTLDMSAATRLFGNTRADVSNLHQPCSTR